MQQISGRGQSLGFRRDRDGLLERDLPLLPEVSTQVAEGPRELAVNLCLLKKLLVLNHPLRVCIRALGTRRGTGLLRRSTGYPVVSAMPSEDVSGELDGFLEIVPRINPI